MVLGPEASPKRARAHAGVCGVGRTRALNQRSGMAGSGVTASDKAKKSLADFSAQQPCLRTQCRITAESVGFVSNREERIEPT